LELTKFEVLMEIRKIWGTIWKRPYILNEQIHKLIKATTNCRKDYDFIIIS